MEKNRRQDLLNIAYKLFISKGYDNTSVDEIIKEAGIAKGTYYYYFTSKEEMLDQVINNMIEKEIEDAKEFLNMDIPIEQKLVGIISSFKPQDNELNIVDALNNEDNIKMHIKYNKKLIDEATILLKDVVKEGIDKKIFNCNNIEERIKLVLVLSNSLFDEQDFTKKDVEIFIDTVEKVFGAKKGSMNFITNLIGGYNE